MFVILWEANYGYPLFGHRQCFRQNTIILTVIPIWILLLQLLTIIVIMITTMSIILFKRMLFFFTKQPTDRQTITSEWAQVRISTFNWHKSPVLKKNCCHITATKQDDVLKHANAMTFRYPVCTLRRVTHKRVPTQLVFRSANENSFLLVVFEYY